MANSEDPDEMQHNAAFHQGLHCLQRLKQSSGTEIHHNLENSICDPLKYIMGSSILIVSICIGKSFKIQRIKAKVFMISGVILYLYHLNMSGFGLHGFQGFHIDNNKIQVHAIHFQVFITFPIHLLELMLNISVNNFSVMPGHFPRMNKYLTEDKVSCSMT